MTDWNKISVRNLEKTAKKPGPGIRSVAHICYTAADLKKSEHFYGEILGLTPS